MKCSWYANNYPIPCCLDLTDSKNLIFAEAAAQAISVMRLADQIPFSCRRSAAGKCRSFHDVSTKFAGIPCNREPGEEDSCDPFWGVLLVSVALLVTLPVAFKLRLPGLFQGGWLISGISAQSFFVTVILLDALRRMIN